MVVSVVDLSEYSDNVELSTIKPKLPTKIFLSLTYLGPLISADTAIFGQNPWEC